MIFSNKLRLGSVVCLAVLLCSLPVNTATYWISSQTGILGTGSEANSFRYIEVAFARVGGGNIFIFKPGVYAGPQLTLYPKYSGSPNSPTVPRPQYK